VAFETPWIRVDANEVTHRVAGDSIYGTVHFKNRALGILPLSEQGDVWLVGQWRFPLRRWSWEIPEGGGRLEGDPLTDAQRELEEETGLRARRWDRWFELDLSNSVTDEKATVFLARELEEVEVRARRSRDATELLEVRKLPLRDACAMVRRGEIRDAITVATLFAAQAAGLLNDPSKALDR
jgi:8-oxo-dGTP pyrophosphatase MutT (NUDIX family)